MPKIDGKKIAEEMVIGLGQRSVPKKFLAVFMVSPDDATKSFVSQKQRVAKKLGVEVRTYEYEKDITNDILRGHIRTITGSKTCGGAIIQLPLPDHINPFYCANAIPLKKDIDCLSDRSVGAIYHNRAKVMVPSVEAVRAVLNVIGRVPTSFAKSAVVGQGYLVGRPVTNWLLARSANVCAYEKGSDLSALCNADLIILGTGQAGLIRADMLKDGAVVIDFGYGTDKKGNIMGDFDSRGADKKNIIYTPTPGGTGPILVAALMQNFYILTE